MKKADFKTINNIIKAYKKGNYMYNNETSAFKFLGFMFIPKKCKRNTKYSFDYYLWKYVPISFFGRLQLILSGDFKVAKNCKKSKEAGV